MGVGSPGKDVPDSMKLPDGYEDYPPFWRVLDQLGPLSYSAIGLARPLPYARRFGARYRFAKSVQEIKLAGYASADTCEGYSWLTRLAFTYTAFETMLALIGVPRKGAYVILKSYPVAKWVKDLTSFDPPGVLFGFVEPRLTSNHETVNVKQFLAGKSCDVTALAAALRHIFLHGELTPNAGGCNPQAVCQICRYLHFMLFGIMDREIQARLERHDKPTG